MEKTYIVTGGAGFIGSALVRYLVGATPHRIVNVDKLTYAGNLGSLAKEVHDHPRYRFYQTDICDYASMEAIFAAHRPDGVFHLAAESHVDRSIEDAAAFMQTNVIGTQRLLAIAREHAAQQAFRFVHVSTDEVYGSLGPQDPAFCETSAYSPRSPYAASKAAADHLARSWHHTYGLPVIVSNCSNNYGPYHYPEKLIPLMIVNALSGLPLPVYGKGANVRDWLHVEDHISALCLLMEQGIPGETYLIGGNQERRNIQVVERICDAIDARVAPPSGLRSRRELIRFVADRPGHDERYAVDSTKITQELGWEPQRTFEEGLSTTVEWFMNNAGWWKPLLEPASMPR